LLLAASGLCFQAQPAGAQDPAPPGAPPKPPDKSKPKPKPNTDTAATSAPDQPTWDPLRAEKDIEVGKYYMHKGDIDAAIDRFDDAVLAKPGYAIPFRYLGEAYEKKREEKTCGEGLPALPRSLSSRRRRRQGPQENRKTKSRNRQRKEAVAFAPHCPSNASMFSSSGCLYL